MTATRVDIDGWLDRLYEGDQYSHMIVMCDTFDWEDYPVYVGVNQDVHEEITKRVGDMNKVMEVYSRNHLREAQMAEFRAFHYD